MSEFKPSILGILCNWCSYAGADLAGVSRFQYPPNIRVLRVMCSGMVDPTMVLDAFILGVDGVLIGGCHLGDCHYLKGNYHAKRKIEVLNKVLEETPLETERLRLEWISASEGKRFAEVISDFTEQIKKLGPNQIKNDPVKMEDLVAARDAMANSRLRAIAGKLEDVLVEGNVYGEKIEPEKIDQLLQEAISTELLAYKIVNKLKANPNSVKNLSKEMGVPAKQILNNVLELKRRGIVNVKNIQGQSPIYGLIQGGDW